MRIRKEYMNLSPLSAAVLGALVAMFAVPTMALAADPTEDEIALIRRPTNFVEITAQNVSQRSAKFGEYNGLNRPDASFNGSFSLRGGDAYQGGDGTFAWGIKGTDIGTTSRELGANIGHQGKWNVSVGYDELRHNTSDTYQTPYIGTNGGSTFTLPAGFANIAIANNAAIGTRGIAATGQAAFFQKMEIGNTRTNSSFALGVNIAPQWDLKLEYNRLEQNGAKLMAFGGDNTGGNATGGEKISILPNPTNYKTDTLNLALNWVGEKAHANASYFGSYFREKNNSVTWSTFTNTAVRDTMTTAPGNDFHQLNFTGGYQLAAKTKLAGGFSYARNTQNDAFITSPLMITAMPTTSLNGKVITTHLDLKLTDQTTKDLALSAGIKYDKRDNQTPSNIYNFFAINGGNAAYYPNTPLSIKKWQLELAGDYRLDKRQQVRLAFNLDNTSRWCNQYASGISGNFQYPVGTNCVVATGAKEAKLAGTYKLKVSDDLNLNAGYSWARRLTTSDPNARTAMQTTSNITGVNGGNVAGLNAGDFLGFVPYLDENRKQQILKGGANWQATERLSLSAGAKFTHDAYDALYGWQSGYQWSLNLDSTYSFSESGSISSYITQQRRHRERTDKRNIVGVSISALGAPTSATALSVPANSTDSGTLVDEDWTLGLAVKDSGLFGGKVELSGDLSYTLGKSNYSTILNFPSATTGGLTCNSPQFLTCGNLPVILYTTVALKLNGTYNLDKASKIGVGVLHQRLTSSDYYYNGLQMGFTPNGLLPTNQQAPSYTVSVISANYTYSFK